MKYPQLVSPRAVNAISDWLVSRLEQLGVESAQIYTRLLLSLLQSSVQVNDPIEFSNLENFFANRKGGGGHRRYHHLPSDTETLKKLNAVQCLREIVSTDYEIATIEQLVDELCEKLKDIEKESHDRNDEDRFLIATPVSRIQTNSHHQHHHHHHQQQQYHHNHNHNHHHNHRHQTQTQAQAHAQPPHPHPHDNHDQQQLPSHVTRQKQLMNSVKENQNQNACEDIPLAANGLETDPKKRYFIAFPALSKEMEESFRNWRRNAKSLTWPVVNAAARVVAENNDNSMQSFSGGGSTISTSTYATEGSHRSGTSSGAGIGAAAIEQKVAVDKMVSKENEKAGNLKSCDNAIAAVTETGLVGPGGGVMAEGGGAAVAVKRKSKRRRNQALSKGKALQNLRKNSIVGNTAQVVGGGGLSGGKQSHHQRHASPASAYWDTDFKGCWEMGPDLIKEFLARQNGNKRRNRSTSESVVTNQTMMRENNRVEGEKAEVGAEVEAEAESAREEEHSQVSVLKADDNGKELKKKGGTLMFLPYVDISFCCDDDNVIDAGGSFIEDDHDDDETLASVPELASDVMNSVGAPPRRLYQRDCNPNATLAASNDVVVVEGEGNGALNDSCCSIDQLDFAQFKAKFNSSVEALWKDAEVETPQVNDFSKKLGAGPINMPSSFNSLTSLSALTTLKENFRNFWSNDKLGYGLAKLSSTASISSMMTRLDESSDLSGVTTDIANTSDYCSMPSNTDDFEKSVGGMRRVTDTTGHTPPIGVFLQNSIWSATEPVNAIGAINTTSTDDDEGFFYKAWHSNNRLGQKGVSFSNCELSCSLPGDGVAKSKESAVNGNFHFPSYGRQKWSEGINAGPQTYSSLRSNYNDGNIDGHFNGDRKSLPVPGSSGIAAANWHTPALGQGLQPDLQSWCASNPLSLTEMYNSVNSVNSMNCNSNTNTNTNDNVVDSSVGRCKQASVVSSNPPELLARALITLPNHCAVSSGFVPYARIKQTMLSQRPVARNYGATVSRSSMGEEENLLTSEHTHFHPIESYADGHCFDISSALDVVEYERSASGYLCHESEKYLEYTRNDNYTTEDDTAAPASATTGSTLGSGVPLYASANRGEAKTSDGSRNETFVIKFRVRCSYEIACQTEEVEEKDEDVDLEKKASRFAEQRPPHPKQLDSPLLFGSVSILNGVAAPGNALSSAWLPAETKGVPLCDAVNWLQDTTICDEVDFGAGPAKNLTQHWSMKEVRKQCELRRQPVMDMKNECSNLSSERSDDSTHTLWGMCAACNSNDFGKSLPADRMLRDELQLEADEIMSDLKYMQDLYIGRENTLEDDNNGDDVDVDDNGDNEVVENDNVVITTDSDCSEWEAEPERRVKPTQVSMLQKVNQLIVDLLRPENATNEKTDLNNDMKPEEIMAPLEGNGKAFCENVWKFDNRNEGNIWQHRSSNSVSKAVGDGSKNDVFSLKPMQLLRQVGGVSEEHKHSTKLHWEHENLARIWQELSPTTETTESAESAEPAESGETAETAEIVKQAVELEKPEYRGEVFEGEKGEDMDAYEMVVRQKNFKNLQNTAALPTTRGTAETYKQVHDFFSVSATKMKTAANRKRRHSASQNFYQQQQEDEPTAVGLHNNNNDDIVNRNGYNSNLSEMKNSNTCPYDELYQQPKQTIITCKYWTTATTTLDSTAATMMLLAAAGSMQTNDTGEECHLQGSCDDDVMLEPPITSNESNFEMDNPFSCLIDKNASILKHVTMMTRPLTR